MSDAFLILRGMALGLLAALFLLVTLRAQGHAVARTLCLLIITLSGYILAPLLYERTALFYPMLILSNWTPVAFLLFSEALFEERTRPSNTVRLIAAAGLLLGVLTVLFPEVPYAEPFGQPLFLVLTRVAMALALLAGLYFVLRHWREDLVENRRRLRFMISLIAGGYILVIVVVETLTFGVDMPLWLEVVHSTVMVLSIAIFFGATVLLDGGRFLSSSPPRDQLPPAAERVDDNPELQKLLAAMETQTRYRDLDLTISSLAAHLGIPEHRLRKLINRELGYRNFSEFLNHYRLTEVSRRLSDPADRRTPILTIAMDAGYRSMTTFNRAFKARFTMTPKEYRGRY